MTHRTAGALRRRVIIAAAALCGLATLAGAVAGEDNELVYPPEGSSSQNGWIYGSVGPTNPWYWSHWMWTDIYAWYGSNNIDILYVNPWDGYDDNPLTITYGAVCVAEQHGYHFQCYYYWASLPFVGTDLSRYIGRTFHYNPAGAWVYIITNFGCETCGSGASQFTYIGPHQ